VLVLQGRGAALKTRWASALCGERYFEGKWQQTRESALFCGNGDFKYHKSDPVRFYDGIMSKWLVDLGELDGVMRAVDPAFLKNLITNRTDRWMPKYSSDTATFQRRTVFLGTVNPKSFLRDPTGNRRFWVIPVEMCCIEKEHAELHGTEYYVHGLNMQQVWAHAYALYQAGETYFPDLDFVEKINQYNAKYEIYNEDGVDLESFFKPVPAGTPAAQWATATEARRHFLKCMGLEEKTDDARALWTRAAEKIVKKWGPTVKSGPNRYPVHLIEPDGSSA
jgi:putative DNA primase/helicase